MAVQIEIDDRSVRRMIGGAQDFVRKPPVQFWKHIQGIARKGSESTYRALAHGGTHRGVRWAPWAESSIGTKRPSGKPVTTSSNLLQDTGTLARRTGEDFRITGRGNELRLGTNVRYAAQQFSRRPALFWAQEDIKPAEKAAANFLERAVKAKPGVR